MAAILQLRRGTTGQKPTLSFGELYLNTTTNLLHLGIDGSGGEIIIAKLNDTNIGDLVIGGDVTITGDLNAAIITLLNQKFDTIGNQSGSWGVTTDLTLLNAFTGSQETKNNNLATYTGSVNSRLNSIESVSASWVLESETSSFFVGASATGNTITFTTADGTTIPVTVTGGTATDITALNLFSQSINTWTASINTKFDTIGSQSGSWGGTNIPAGTVSGSVQVDHNLTTNYVANQHIDHSLVSITAGSGLTGGGNLTATRTLSIANGGVSNAMLANSAITIAGTSVALGSSITLATITGGSSIVSGSGFISSSSQLTGSFETTGRDIVSSSSQLTSSFDIRYETRGRGIVSSSTQIAALLPTNVVSASTDTATIDITIAAGTISAVAIGGIVSGSSQLTASLDERYIRTGSFNALSSSYVILSSSYNPFTSSMNDFTQSVLGLIGAGSNIISLNQSSLYSTAPVTTGYSTNNGIFFGRNAGGGASLADRSIFLGSNAGSGSTNANDSIFFGSGSGQQAENANESVFLGILAGYNATSANTSIFLGSQAGVSSTNADNAVMIGTLAGAYATNAEYSNFIGRIAGYGASNASYSNLFGYAAGKQIAGTGNGIGTNNIVIGTNITLEHDRQDSINIGGIIFGTGSYGTTGGDPYSGSVNGKIGINVVFPQAELHVSGSGIFTNTFTASLQEGYVWVGGAGNTSSLAPTSSFTGVGALPSGVVSSSAQITALGFVSSSITGSSLITASATGNTITFTKGDNTNFNVVVSGGGDTTLLNIHSASVNSYTQSNDARWNNLANQSGSWITETESGSFLITASVNNNTITFTKGDASTFALTLVGGDTTLLNIHSASVNLYTQSNDARWNNLANQSGSWVTEAETASFFISASAALNVLTFTKGDNTTSTVTIHTGSFLIPTGTISGSAQITAFGFVSGSYVTTSSFNDYTASISTASLISRLNAIEAVSNSWVTEPETASFFISASVNNNVITFTKGNNTTSDITITGAGGDTTLLNIHSASVNLFTASVNTKFDTLQNVTASLNSFTASINTTIKDKLNADGVLSGSAQVIAALPTNVVSASSDTANVDITISSGVISAELKGGVISSSAQIVLPTNVVSASQDTSTIDMTINAGTISAVAIGGIVSSSAQITALGFVSSSITASSLITASISGQVLTFTKGNNNTFSLVIPTGSAVNSYTAGFNSNNWVVNHNLNTSYPIVFAYESGSQWVLPASLEVTSPNTVTLGFSSIVSGSVIVTTLGAVGGTANSQTYIETITSTTSQTITHNLDTEWPIVQFYENSSKAQQIPESVVSVNLNQITITFSNPVSGKVVIKK